MSGIPEGFSGYRKVIRDPGRNRSISRSVHEGSRNASTGIPYSKRRGSRKASSEQSASVQRCKFEDFAIDLIFCVWTTALSPPIVIRKAVETDMLMLEGKRSVYAHNMPQA